MQKLFLLCLMSGFLGHAIADEHVIKTPAELNWKDGPPTLPKGVQMAVLTGDPGKSGPFTMRLKFPATYQIPAHWHSQVENVTVIEGELHLGFGDKLDESKSHSIPVGGFAMMPKKHRHFAYTKNLPTIVQLHGQGPFDITYVNPEDDPRKKK